MSRLFGLLGVGFLLCAMPVHAHTIKIVAAENFYADVARQIAGPGASVTAVMSNPDQDPHLFEATASVARAIADSRIAVLNGVDYDPWMRQLLAAQPEADRMVIDVGVLVHAPKGANPHLWYNPATMPLYARALTDDLSRIDPAGKPGYTARLQGFLASLAPLNERIAAMHRRWRGTAVTATEPVFGYMASALGLVMRNERFQLSVMNDTEPSAGDTATFERDLRTHQVHVLIYNSQASDAAVERLRRIAAQAGVPTIGVTETAPPGQTYEHWMLAQLDALDAALGR